jgi:hypothetical protein
MRQPFANFHPHAASVLSNVPHIYVLRVTASRLLIKSDKYRSALAAAIPARVWAADEWATFTRKQVDRK